jgi:hypothetical protein
VLVYPAVYLPWRKLLLARAWEQDTEERKGRVANAGAMKPAPTARA